MQASQVLTGNTQVQERAEKAIDLLNDQTRFSGQGIKDNISFRYDKTTQRHEIVVPMKVRFNGKSQDVKFRWVYSNEPSESFIVQKRADEPREASQSEKDALQETNREFQQKMSKARNNYEASGVHRDHMNSIHSEIEDRRWFTESITAASLGKILKRELINRLDMYKNSGETDLEFAKKLSTNRRQEIAEQVRQLGFFIDSLSA